MTKRPTPPLWLQLQMTQGCLDQVLQGASSAHVLRALDPQDRAGVQSLLFYTLRRLGRAQALLKLLAQRPPKGSVAALLCIGLSLASEDQDPLYTEFTLVSQSVQAAKNSPAMKSQGAFINACLRRFFRERDALLQAIQHSVPAQWNYPAWWVERVRAEYPAQWQSILHAGNQMPPLTVRVNRAKTDRATLAQRWHALGLESQVQGEQALALLKPLAVQDIPGFAEGLCTVQDAGAQRAAQILMHALRPAMRGAPLPDNAGTGGAAGTGTLTVLDACAAPGGKTTHLLEFEGVQVTALDIDAERCARVQESCERVGARASVICADAGDLQAWWTGEAFDAILLDAPCTASGIVRRHPDIRWLRRQADVAQLAQQQSKLLQSLWPVLKRGGYLLYCTCSIFKQEGTDQIQAFLSRNTGASICGQAEHLLPCGHTNGALVKDNEMNDHDGFFYALLQKS